jgi:hypothetical protein
MSTKSMYNIVYYEITNTFASLYKTNIIKL